MIFVGVSSRLPPPTWKAENEHGWQLVHCASAAEIFIGWYFVSITPRWLPTAKLRAEAGSSTTSDTTADRRNSSTSFPRRRYHAETASMTSAPVTSDASSTCA